MALRWGICSAGNISHKFIVGLKTLPESSHQVSAIAARSIESAKKLASTHSVTKTYGSYDELASDPDIDVVYIGTIHPTHFSAACKMLEAGKPVLCEKPLTMNATETKTLIELAKSKNLFLMEGVWMRYFPVMVELRRLLANNAIGDVDYVNVTFGFRSSSTLPDRLIKPELGASAVLDIGIYVINFTSMVFGGIKPDKIHAEGILSPDGIDNTVAMTLTYSGNRIAQLSISVVTELPCEAIVSGTKGEIKVPKRFWCPTQLITPEGTFDYPLPKPYMQTNSFSNPAGFCYEAEEVRRCLSQGEKESPVMPLQETQLIAEIMDEVLRQVGYSPKT